MRAGEPGIIDVQHAKGRGARLVEPGHRLAQRAAQGLFGGRGPIEIGHSLLRTVDRSQIGAAAEVLVPGEAARVPATLREIGWQVRRSTQATTDPVAAVDARTVEVRLTLPPEAAEALARRSNMQVQVAIRP